MDSDPHQFSLLDPDPGGKRNADPDPQPWFELNDVVIENLLLWKNRFESDSPVSTLQ